MIDTLTLLNIFIQLLITICISGLLILHAFNIYNKQTTNYLFLLAIFFGFLGIFLFLLDTITWEIEPNPELRIFIEIFVNLFMPTFFYLLYRHYESIYRELVSNKRKYLLSTLLGLQIVIATLHLLGIFPYQLIFDLYGTLGFPNYGRPSADIFGNVAQFNNIVITYLSHNHQLIGILVFSILSYDIYRLKLVQMQKIGRLEFNSIIILILANILLLLNNILVTQQIYSLNIAYDVLVIPFGISFLGLIMLILNYVIRYPPHILKPKEVLDIGEFTQYIETISNLHQKSLKKG